MIRFFEGQTSVEEEETLFQWMAEDFANVQEFFHERRNYDLELVSNDRLTVPVDIEKEYEKIKKFIADNKKLDAEKRSVEKRSLRIKYFRQAVSYAAIIICCIFLLKEFLQERNPQEGVVSQNTELSVPQDTRSRVATAPEECKEVQVVKGTKRELRLPDHTRVWINSQSKLKFPEKFEGNTREVWLEGEAYFEVAKDLKKQFIVHTNEFDIRVYGTSFNVSAYKEYSEKTFTLLEGSIKLTSNLDADNRELFLVPGQQAVYDEGQLNIKEVDPVTEVSWKDNKFYFREKTFQAICRQLEHAFNVTILIEGDNLKNSVYTGDFVRNENLKEILDIMSADSRIEYKIEGNTITVKEK